MTKLSAMQRILLSLAFGILHSNTAWTADAKKCAELDRLDYRVACETSPECMSVKNPEGGAGAYLCVPAANECQEDFKQMKLLQERVEDPDYDAESACVSKQGCNYVPAGQCYCPPLATCVCGGGSPSNCIPNG